MLVDRIESFHGKKNRCRVCFRGETDLVLYSKEVEQYGLKEEEDVPEEVYESIIEEILIPRAKKRALHLLEKQDRTEKNLRDKLLEGGFPPKAAEAAIEYVRSYHYIDDDRYGENYVRYHMEGKSKKRVLTDLIGRGMDPERAREIIDRDYESNEEEMVIKLLQKKNYDPKSADEKEKMKMFRFLAGRGFSYEVIKSALEKTKD